MYFYKNLSPGEAKKICHGLTVNGATIYRAPHLSTRLPYMKPPFFLLLFQVFAAPEKSILQLGRLPDVFLLNFGILKPCNLSLLGLIKLTDY